MSVDSDLIINLLLSSITGTLCAIGIVWLSRQWISERLHQAIKSEYDQKLETHKAQLKSSSDIEIERLRSSLSQIAKEHDVIFTRLHDKRADAISKIYTGLRKVHLALGEYVKVFEIGKEKPREEKWKDLVGAHDAFFQEYISNIIFLPKRIADMLDALNKSFVVAGTQFNLLVLNQNNPNRHQMWTEIAERHEGEIKGALNDLEAEFRKLLGDKE